MKYPEFENIINEIVKNTCIEINNKSYKIKSKMPYKSQYVLEEVIKLLEEKI